MGDELSEPKRVPVPSLVTLAITVFFCVYGGYLVLICVSVGVPTVEPFDQFDSEIPAITALAMDLPSGVTPGIYAIAAAWLGWCSYQASPKRLLCVFNLMVASTALLFLYLMYFAVAVLPGSKLIGELGLR